LFSKEPLGLFAGESVEARGSIGLKENHPERFYIGSADSLCSFGFASPIYRWRASVLKALVDRIENMGYPASSLFKALFLGIRDEVPEIIRQGFATTGTSHFLAISGLHVGIVYMVVLFLTRMLRKRFSRWALGSAILILYLFFVGPRPSIVRASVAAILAGLSALMDRDMNPLNLFGLVLLVVQLIDPVSVYSPAFQLSFLSIAGILFVGRALYRSLQRHVPAVISLPLACSIGAQFATAPAQFLLYGIFYPAGVIVTILLIPLVSSFIWCGLAVLLLDPITPLWFDGLGRTIMLALYRGILAVLKAFSNAPGLTRSSLPYYWYLLGIGIMLRLGIGIMLRLGVKLPSAPQRVIALDRRTLESPDEEGVQP
jgi:competence protein ComEC